MPKRLALPLSGSCERILNVVKHHRAKEAQVDPPGAKDHWSRQLPIVGGDGTGPRAIRALVVLGMREQVRPVDEQFLIRSHLGQGLGSG